MLIKYNNKEFYTSKDLALSVIGGRWKIAIVYHLLNSDRLRLSELQNKLPDINQRMLIRQLRELEQDKIIERTIYPVVPPKVDYKLTDIGLKLDKVVFSICNWGDSFLDKVRRDT
ncbi:transcriptional regulator [Staphylococcus sp. HMSC10C03]|uniref:winged helix-turn-helix transcriptional regulator n=1 Tax=Staphylococcus sp. HMSC10C03 TaxID=1581078 RepID=UPI0008A48C0D|nr:helix-turn-helix domain-containing protein [Staphylococcus sp. HMSC10C03]OFU76752.1 transcriptional regulator [Staphylococcus sp. HMSC10C03]